MWRSPWQNFEGKWKKKKRCIERRKEEWERRVQQRREGTERDVFLFAEKVTFWRKKLKKASSCETRGRQNVALLHREKEKEEDFDNRRGDT